MILSQWNVRCNFQCTAGDVYNARTSLMCACPSQQPKRYHFAGRCRPVRRCAQCRNSLQKGRLRAKRDRSARFEGGYPAPQERRHVRDKGLPLAGLQLPHVGHPAVLRRTAGTTSCV